MRRSWLQARQRVDDLDATLQVETADLRARVRNAWRQELPQAQRAADIVREGTGRLGQRRRQVRDAHADLTAFAERWHPVLADLTTDPAELAVQLPRLHARRVEDQIEAFVAQQIAAAHPDAEQIRHAEREAMAASENADRARTQLDNHMYAELRPYGRAAHVSNPRERLTNLTAELADVERDLRAATSRVRAVSNEPSIRTLPSGGLDSEHDRWVADRRARQQADAHDGRERLRLQQEKARRIEPTPPNRSTPGRGGGIGR
ncbi:MAG: TrwC9 [Nocardioides sp.]|uniref:hypothetical protein n=1 Tax=Nocardioides sp. TaxID=35761 RepID=UPI0026117FF5|nr:hypothetical protein [Nocardioides sp.]MCW2833658.1 TrwC9 [Nocardioides sp.]